MLLHKRINLFLSGVSENRIKRDFTKQRDLLCAALSFNPNLLNKADSMTNHYKFDIIIIGGSYSGLSAAIAFGHLLKTG